VDPVDTLLDALEALGGTGEGDAANLLRALADWIDRGGAVDGLAEIAGLLLEGLRGTS
jgi:hypothetical protein